MKFIRPFSTILALVFFFSSITPAQNLTATRPRQVKEVTEPVSPSQSGQNTAIEARVSGSGPDLTVLSPWVHLVKTDPARDSAGMMNQSLKLMTIANRAIQNRRIFLRPDSIRNGDRSIVGRASPGSSVEAIRVDRVSQATGGDTKLGNTAITSTRGEFVIRLDANQTVEENDTITITATLNGVSRSATLIVTGGSQLVGILVGGVVLSQQAKNFSQSDPFAGFIGGYMVPMISKSSHRHTGSFNLRFQGIFQADARTAQAPPVDTSMTPASKFKTLADSSTPEDTFISSRKTFDMDAHLWYEWLLPSQILAVGPYAAIGFSTALDKNELIGEDVSTGNGSGASDQKLDTTKVSTDNDLKKYYEGGLLMDFYSGHRDDKNLYMQAILAYGNYEALAGLAPGHNTKHRVIGKLRIFPSGIARDFFGSVGAPMFGVDLNAGRGEDHLKFFIGMTIDMVKLKKLFGQNDEAAAGNSADTSDGNSNSGGNSGGSSSRPPQRY